jgi:hypothetical protein
MKPNGALCIFGHEPVVSPDRLMSMITPDFLRRQAENCLRIARSCFDLGSAERLRLMAVELHAKADEIDRRDLHSRLSPAGAPSFQGNDR